MTPEGSAAAAYLQPAISKSDRILGGPIGGHEHGNSALDH